MDGDIPTPFQTNLEIIHDVDKLLQECIDWSMNTFGEYKDPNEKLDSYGKQQSVGYIKNYFTSEDIRSIGISRFIYLQGKLFNHSDKWHRDQDLKKKNVGKDTSIIKNV